MELSLCRFFSFSRASCSMLRLRKLPYTMSRMDIRHVDTRDPNSSTAIIVFRLLGGRSGGSEVHSDFRRNPRDYGFVRPKKFTQTVAGRNRDSLIIII